MTRILVTGGAGYIGSHCCKAIAQAGYEPVVYDNLSTGHVDELTEMWLRDGALEGYLLPITVMDALVRSPRSHAVNGSLE